MAPVEKSSSGVRLCRIYLELARSKLHAEGSALEGYEFIAPLDDANHIDLDAWKRQRALCFVHRLERGSIAERGVLVHKAGGVGGATWAFDYEPGGAADEEAGYRFGAHAFKPGEYVSIRDEDGEMLTYRVTSVKPA